MLHFDTAGLPAIFPEGIAVDNSLKRIFLLDNTTDEVYELDVPRFFEATTISGTFLSGSGIRVNFKETGDGFISGEVILPGAAVGKKIFGIKITPQIASHGLGSDVAAIFDGSALTLDVMTDLGVGPVTFSGTVASDLNSFVIGGVTLIRQ